MIILAAGLVGYADGKIWEDKSYIIKEHETKDDDKSLKRFKRDKELLMSDYKNDKNEPRTLFYLAQTCSCLGEHDEAYFFYRLRTELEAFQEEKFHESQKRV